MNAMRSPGDRNASKCSDAMGFGAQTKLWEIDRERGSVTASDHGDGNQDAMLSRSVQHEVQQPVVQKHQEQSDGAQIDLQKQDPEAVARPWRTSLWGYITGFDKTPLIGSQRSG